MRLRSWFIASISVFAVASTACNAGGSAPARGFGSRQLASVRDPTIRLIDQQTENLFVYSTGSDPASFSIVGGTYWSVNLESGLVENLGIQFPTFLPLSGTSTRYACQRVSTGATASTTLDETFLITDTQSGVKTEIDRVASAFSCPTESHPDLVLLRIDDSGKLVLWLGRYDQMQPVPGDLIIEALIAGRDDQSIAVIAALPTQPDARGIFSIDPVTFAYAPLVPPILGDADWARDAAPKGSLVSAGLVGRAQKVGSHYLYPRAMDDGGTTMFSGPFAEGPHELALFREDGLVGQIPPAGQTFLFGTPTTAAPSRIAWSEHYDTSLGDLALAWDDDLRSLVSCAVPTANSLITGVVVPRNAGCTLFGSNDPNPYPIFVSPQNKGPLLLAFPGEVDASLPGSGCKLLAADVVHAAFSSDCSGLLWVSAPDGGAHELWTAGGDGSAPRKLGAGAIDLFAPPHFVTNTRIELKLDGDLVWLDLGEDSMALHDVAQKISGVSIDLIPPWLLTEYQYSPEDRTGILGLINRDTGIRRPISDWVAAYSRLRVTPPSNGSALTSMLYLVRGRNPSPQDGLWLAKITADDLR